MKSGNRRRAFARIAIVTALALPSAGCLLVTYEPPTEGPMADVTVRNATARPMSVQLYADSRTCKGRRTLMPITKPGQSREVRVSAVGDTTFTLAQDVAWNIGCIGTFTFKPIAGHSYDVTYTANTSYCRVRLIDLKGGPNGGPVDVDYRKREWQAAFDETGSFCPAE